MNLALRQRFIIHLINHFELGIVIFRGKNVGIHRQVQNRTTNIHH
jgi:hypothetical protein